MDLKPEIRVQLGKTVWESVWRIVVSTMPSWKKRSHDCAGFLDPFDARPFPVLCFPSSGIFDSNVGLGNTHFSSFYWNRDNFGGQPLPLLVVLFLAFSLWTGRHLHLFHRRAIDAVSNILIIRRCMRTKKSVPKGTVCFRFDRNFVNAIFQTMQTKG